VRTISPTGFGGSILRIAAGASIGAAIVVGGMFALSRQGSDEAPDPASMLGGGTVPYFSVIGSGGTVDEADLDVVALGGGIAQLKNTAPDTETAVIRYPVYALQNLVANYTFIALSARFRDNGANAQVIIRLKEVDIGTGTETTRLTFNSNNSGSNNSFQTDSVTDDSPDWELNFVENTYYLEVQLKKTAGGGKPALAAVQLLVLNI